MLEEWLFIYNSSMKTLLARLLRTVDGSTWVPLVSASSEYRRPTRHQRIINRCSGFADSAVLPAARLTGTSRRSNMKVLWMSLLTLFVSCHRSRSLPLPASGLTRGHHPGPSEADQEFAQEYLRHFYSYSHTSDRRRRSAATTGGDWTTGLCVKVQEMQKFFGLPPSGELTNETLAVMKRPRCGLSDVERFEETSRWKKHFLSYSISGHHLHVQKGFKLFRKALDMWSTVIPLRFKRRRRREADIVISFHSGDHKDGSPFDGKGGILAHAFLPGHGIGGDVHFDADEDWSLNFTGFNLLTVAVHEFGHALGLEHSSDPGAVMYPAYNFSPGYVLQLSHSDVKDVQHMYGASEGFDSLKPPPRTPDRCDPDLSFDAVSKLQQELVVFKDRFMWRKHPQFDRTGITLISSLWSHSVPSHLDAVYENWAENYLMFFKDHMYWVMRHLQLQEGFPKNISNLGFPSRIRSIDAALHFRAERFTVFFTGHECWRYNEEHEMMDYSPELIEQQWPGVPAPVDAAVFHEGDVHFFKGNTDYIYDLKSKRVISTSPVNDLLECTEQRIMNDI